MKNPTESGYNLSDLNELALEADIYVNEPSRRRARKRRINEVLPMLDETARPLYIDQPVRVFGVHGRSEFMVEQGAIKHYMSAGQVTGISEGFVAIDYDKWGDMFTEQGDERHFRLLSELRERAVGSVGIAHLVRRKMITFSRADLLSAYVLISRAVAPVASSYLYPETEQPLVMHEEERLDELVRILSVSSPELSEVFARMQAKVKSEADPLIALSECAEDFSRLCNEGDVNAVSAAHDYLNLVAGPRFFGRIYRFNELLPPSLIREPQGPVQICEFNDTQFDMLMMNLVIGREVEQRGNTLLLNDNNALYAVARLYEDGAVGPSDFYIPLDKLQGKDFSVISSEESV